MGKLLYYISPAGDNPVSNFLFSLSERQQQKLIRIFKHLEEFGVKGPRENVKKLSGTPLWEIRILGNDNIRIIYVVIIHGQVLLLHAFIKKKQKTPIQELKTSLNRYREWIKSNPRLTS